MGEGLDRSRGGDESRDLEEGPFSRDCGGSSQAF